MNNDELKLSNQDEQSKDNLDWQMSIIDFGLIGCDVNYN